MAQYEVRTNCEYIIEIEANTEDEARMKASDIDFEHWDKAWAPFEAEFIDEEDS